MSTLLRLFRSLSWPSPVLEEEVSVDPYVAASLVGDGLELTLESGTRLQARCTVPIPGVLRIRVGEALDLPGPSPMLVDLPDPPAKLTASEEQIRIEGPGIDAGWPTQGGWAHCGAWQRSPIFRVIPGAVGGAGRLLSSGRPVGWLETARLGPDDAMYGGGESFQGPNIRGRLRRLVNSEACGASGLDVAYLNVPFFWSDAGWGILLHSGAPTRADLGSTHSEVATFAVEDEELDVFLLGGDPMTILRRYHALTGLPGGVPDWALGVWTSRCTYISAQEIDDVLDGYARAACPVDVVHVDGWVEGNVIKDLTCNWSVDRGRFPEGWARRLLERGIRTSLWQNPYILEGSNLAGELWERGLLVRARDGTPARTNDRTDRFLVDFTNPDAVTWWKEQVRRVVREEGNASFKPDFAEEVPEDAVFADGRNGRALRNEYALLYQRATHEALCEALGTEDVALFCRSGTTGVHRYPCHWVGDTPSTWDGLVTALRACLSLSLSGFGIVAHDVGGFSAGGGRWAGEMLEAMDPSGFAADVEPELFARWSQWGALSPMMRFHGNGRREPTAYPEPARSVAVEACRMRDRLRPYLVRIATEAAATGMPMMRPMALAFPDDRAARDAELQYLLGPDVLVAPVLGPGGERSLYVPEGRWGPIWGLDTVGGPGWTTVRCPLDTFPAFVREGVTLPDRR